ncbi:hypothetical protein [Streptomyces sp. NPDC001537]
MAPVFEHADKLFALLHSLVRRPKKGEFPEATEGQDGLPVVMLVGYEESELAELAETIDKRSCKEAQPPRIPHKLIDVSGVLATMNRERPDLEGDWRRAELYRRVLVELAMEFASPSNSPDARVQFRRFGLVNWLLETNNTADPLRGQPDHELLMRLQTRELQRRGFFRVLRNPTTEVALEGRAPWWAWILGLHVLPVLWFRAWRAVGPEYRWLLRQPYMAPRDPGTFAGFALRLTQPRFEHENPEQVGKLLVNAFLEDLRVAYRRRIWRRRAWRRTTYCVALLKGVREDNFGQQLIRSLIEVRIETGDFDPLLVIGTSRTHDYAGPQWGQLEDDLVMNWGAQFVAARRGRSAEDWYLPVRIPATLDPGTDAYTRHSKNLLPKLQFRPEPSPRWARRRVTALAVVLAVALVAGAVGWRLDPAPEERWEQQHCKLPRTDPDAATVETRGAECVGVAPHGFAFGSQDESLQKTLKKIDEQNRAAEEMHRDAPDRPIVTLVHLSALLSSPGTGKAAGLLSYAREALQGVASAQKRQLNRTGSEDPLLRVLPASAGLNMQYGPEVVGMIAKMMRTDPTIVGVTGLDQSRKATITTIHRLTRIGLPMVATTLSADTLPEASPLYYQVSPQNRREAAVAAAYSKHLVADSGGRLKPRVRVIYSADPTDEYSSNLRPTLRRPSTTRASTSSSRPTSPPPRPPELPTPPKSARSARAPVTTRALSSSPGAPRTSTPSCPPPTTPAADPTRPPSSPATTSRGSQPTRTGEAPTRASRTTSWTSPRASGPATSPATSTPSCKRCSRTSATVWRTPPSTGTPRLPSTRSTSTSRPSPRFRAPRTGCRSRRAPCGRRWAASTGTAPSTGRAGASTSAGWWTARCRSTS